MSMWYQLGLSQLYLAKLPSDQKFDILRQFCKKYRVPELCEVIDDQVYLFCYDSDLEIVSIPYDEYFGDRSSSRKILENYHNWCGSVPYGLDILPDLNGDIFIPLWEGAETTIELPNTPLDGLCCAGVDYYLLPKVRENIELVDKTDATKEAYLEINLSLKRICTIAETYGMCICWSY